MLKRVFDQIQGHDSLEATYSLVEWQDVFPVVRNSANADHDDHTGFLGGA